MESIACHESLAKKEGERLDKRCSIFVHSRTKRLADEDGRSVKAAIDGLREAGVLKDDNTKFVKKVEQSQEITTEDEETIINIVWDIERPPVKRMDPSAIDLGRAGKE